MRAFRRFLPFTTMSGAALFALRHRKPILDWGLWTVRSVPRVLGDERDDVLAEAKLRVRVQGDGRFDGDQIAVDVIDGRAVLRGEVAEGHSELVADLAGEQKGIDEVEDRLRERRRSRRRLAA